MDSHLLSTTFACAPDDSVELARRAQRGDRAALEELFRRYQDRVLRIVRVRLGSGLRAQLESMDIVQDVFVIVQRKLPDLEVRGPGALFQWLAKIVENRIHDVQGHLFAQKRDRGRERPLDPGGAGDSGDSGGGAPAIPGAGPSPSEQAARNEVGDVLDDELSRLPEHHRTVILLRDYCGADWPEIAADLDRSPGAAQELHRRAWIQLAWAAGPRLKRG